MKKVIEWTPGKWWIVAATGEDGSYTPYAGPYPTRERAEYELEALGPRLHPTGRPTTPRNVPPTPVPAIGHYLAVVDGALIGQPMLADGSTPDLSLESEAWYEVTAPREEDVAIFNAALGTRYTFDQFAGR